MAQIVLADEINRAGPRTQSALLEAMEERQVTVDGETRRLPYPFLVMATQNPIELEGTFPLPEAQVDRFLMRVGVGYPQREEERQILRRFRTDNPLDRVEPLADADDLRRAHAICRTVYVHPAVEDYILDLVLASRQHADVELGASPRGSLALYRTGQALAAMRGRSYVDPRRRAGTGRSPCWAIASSCARMRACAGAPSPRCSTKSWSRRPSPWKKSGSRRPPRAVSRAEA